MKTRLELQELYTDEYFDNYGGESYDDEQLRRFEARLRLRWISSNAGLGKLLEIGAVNGIFLDSARDFGFEVTGVEPADGYAEYARREFGLDVRSGFIETVELPDSEFDVVCAFHVFEHISGPGDALARIHSAMKPGGLLFLEFPNIESRQASKLGMDWVPLEPEFHVAFYNKSQLERLLRDNGFELLDFHTVSTFTYYPKSRLRRPGNLLARLWRTLRSGVREGAPHPDEHELVRATARRI